LVLVKVNFDAHTGKKAVVALSLGIIVFLAFFWRLDGALLWRDEATTANWGRELLRSETVLPTVWNGEQLIVQGSTGHDFNAGFVPSMQGWLQLYVIAGAFKIFGASTYSARIIFALFGLAGMIVLFLMFRRMFGESRLALFAGALCILSLPYLHYARQARYYALVLLLSILILYEILRFIQEKNTGSIWTFVRLGLYGILLFFSNYFTFALIWLGILFAVPLVDGKRFFAGFLITSLAMLAIIIPFTLTVHWPFITRAEITNWGYVQDYWEWFLMTLERGNYLVPLYIFLPVGLYFQLRHREKFMLQRRFTWILWILIGVSLVVATIINKSNTFLRYQLHLIPIILLLSGIYLFWTLKIYGKVIAIVSLSLLFFYHNWTPVLNSSEAILKRQFSLNDSYNRPMIRFLDDNLGENESVMFIPSQKGMVAYFYLPDIRWYGILEANNPYNKPYKEVLPPTMFDDYNGIDWIVVSDIFGQPSRIDYGYELVWSYRYGPDAPPPQKADKNIYTPKQYTITQAESGNIEAPEYFDFYRRTPLEN